MSILSTRAQHPRTRGHPCLLTRERLAAANVIFPAMEDEVLKGQFDAVVLGTGLVQSILAGALALHGKKVIHIDKNDFYGEYTSSHTLDSFPSTDASPGELPMAHGRAGAQRAGTGWEAQRNCALASSRGLPRLLGSAGQRRHYFRRDVTNICAPRKKGTGRMNNNRYGDSARQTSRVALQL